MDNLVSQLPVYEKKPGISSKIASWWRSLSFMTKIVAVLAVTAISLTGLATRSFQATQIALISEQSSQVTPVQPPVTEPQPTIIPSPVTCQNGVRSISLSDTCGSMGFRYSSFSCNNGKGGYQGDGSICLSADDAMTYAYNTCRCVTQPPAPSPIAPPSPIVSPSPRVCSLESGSCVSKTKNCMSYNDSCAKADFCATPFQTCGSPVPSPSGKLTASASPLPPNCKYVATECYKAPCPQKIVCVSPVPTPTPTPTPTPKPTPQPAPSNVVTTYICKLRCNIRYIRNRASATVCSRSCR